MASEEVLDFEKLLAPISEDRPSGTELKEDSAQSALYYQIKDARETARAAERHLATAVLYGDKKEVASISPPDWKLVKRLALDVLTTKSKDLWVAAWLIEAITRLHGFPGLRDGFRLARELVERFWDEIHPRPDDEGYVTTVAQLTGLNGDDSEGALIAPIEAIPITAGKSHDPLSSRDYRQASNPKPSADAERAARTGKPAITMEMFQGAVAETPPEFFLQLIEDIDQTVAEFDRLGEALEQRCGLDESGYSAAPPSSNIRTALQECRDRVRWLARDILGGEEQQSPGTDSGEPTASQAAGTSTTMAGGAVRTREEAFRTLLQVAEFFRRTEPHSPVSYALEQAVRWGKMALPELMAELISEESTRNDLFRRVGIPKPDSSRDD